MLGTWRLPAGNSEVTLDLYWIYIGPVLDLYWAYPDRIPACLVLVMKYTPSDSPILLRTRISAN
jgi:hypothetical protein